MAEFNHVVENDHGPVVEITIGLSFMEEERRRRRGDATPARRTIRAAIHTGLATTLVSETLRQELDPDQRGLHYELRVQEIVLLGAAQRSQATFSVAVPELGPMFKGVEAIIVPLPGPVQCFLGRNFLNVAKATFSYDGDYELFSLSTSWI